MEESRWQKTTGLLIGPRGRGLALGLIVAGIMVILSFLPMGHSLENQTLDLFYRLRPAAPQPADLLTVSIDEASFQELKEPWPWPRRLHAKLVHRLAAAGARLIIFDVIFADPTDPEDDILLARAIQEAGNVILGSTFETTKDPHFTRRVLITPYKPFQIAAKAQGLCMITPDYDGVVRRFRLSLGGRETMPLVAYRQVRPQNFLLPNLAGLINYAGPARSIDTVSYYQVIDDHRPLPQSRIRGRIVLVGRMLEASATPQAQADAFYTPFFAGNGQLMSGAEIQGNIIHTLLEGTWGQELQPWQQALLLVAVIFLGSIILIRLNPISGLIFTGALLVLIPAVSFGLFLFARFWLPPFLMSIGLAAVYSGNILGHYFVEAKEKRWLRQAFGRYVSHSVVEIIINHPHRLELGGEEFETTVLFADLEGFTQLCETMPPPALIKLLNDYFSPMTHVIMRHQGTLDKYIGDSIMALWGAPVPLSDHALQACRAALEMEKTMSDLQQGWRIQGLPPLVARLGLHSGSVVAGNVGSRERFNYTVLGDTVNLASRLEGVNKVYGTRILLSDNTWGYVRDHFLVRELDLVQVKGREKPVTIYELLDELPLEADKAWLDHFAAGLQAYRQRQWEEAARSFNEVLRLEPQDRPAQVFLDRCRFFAASPPPPDWQGIFVLDAK